MEQWFSSADLVARIVPEIPRTQPRVANWIARVAAASPELVRKRAGRGGGLEVHVSALPLAAQQVLRAAAAPALPTLAEAEARAAALDADQRQILSAAAPNLTGRQRLVMGARQALLLSIEAEAAQAGKGRDHAIRAFVAKATAGLLPPEQRQLLARANDRSGPMQTISRPTLYRWFQAREARGLVALAPETTRDKDAMPAWFDGFFSYYGRPSKPSVSAALRDYCRTLPPGAPHPTERQARTALAKLPVLERLRGRAGQLALRARRAYVARDFSDLTPTSVYAADGKTFDAEIQHPIHGQPFRPEITTIVDVATRFAVGWSAALDESAHAVTDALRRACTPADGVHGGIPALFYTDRGPGYVNEAMEAPLTGLMARLGTSPMRALPYNSQAKGVIERLNQAYTHGAKSLPTYIGRDMDKEAKLLAYKSTRRDLALTGTSGLLPSWESFLALIQDTLDDYNDRPHSELPKIRCAQLGRMRHMSPRELWDLKAAGFEPIIPSSAEAEDLFRPWVVRRTRRALVDWLGNSYFAPELEALDGTDVIVGYDIRDASRVMVRMIDELDGERIPGRLIATAIFEGHKTRYVPVTAERAALEKRQKARLARVALKADGIRRELEPGVLIDMTSRQVVASATGPAPVITAEPLPAARRTDNNVVILPGGRPQFRDDVSFASWLAANPSEATASDVALLVELITSHSMQELLRMSGVDLEALRSIVRSARAAGAVRA